MHYPLIQFGHVRWRRLPHACMSPPPQERPSWLALRNVYVLCACMHCSCDGKDFPMRASHPPLQERPSLLALRSVYVLCAYMPYSCHGRDFPMRAYHPFNRMGRTLDQQSRTEYCAFWSPSYLAGRARCTERLHERGSCSADISLLLPVTHQHTMARTTPATCPYTHAVMPAVCRTSTLGLVHQGACSKTQLHCRRGNAQKCHRHCKHA